MLDYFAHGDGTKAKENFEGILKAAMKVFADVGYANTTLEIIAKEINAPVSVVEAAFPDKSLIYKAIFPCIIDYEGLFADCTDPLEVLVVIVEEVKESISKKDRRAKFLYRYFALNEIPVDLRNSIRNEVDSSDFYVKLKILAASSRVETANPYELLEKLVISTSEILKGYFDAGLDFPDNDFFMNIIGYRDEVGAFSDKDLIRQQSSVIAAFASDFQSILFVDLDTDKIEVYQASGEHDNWIVSTAKQGFEEYKHRFADRFLLPEDREWFLREMAAETIKNKLEDEPVIYVDHYVLKHGEPLKYQTKVVLDPMESRGNKVLIGGHRIY